jgi:hypothetical protein
VIEEIFCIKLKKLGATRDWDDSVMNDFEIDTRTRIIQVQYLVLYVLDVSVRACFARDSGTYYSSTSHAGPSTSGVSFVVTTNQSHSNSHFASKYLSCGDSGTYGTLHAGPSLVPRLSHFASKYLSWGDSGTYSTLHAGPSLVSRLSHFAFKYTVL